MLFARAGLHRFRRPICPPQGASCAPLVALVALLTLLGAGVPVNAASGTPPARPARHMIAAKRPPSTATKPARSPLKNPEANAATKPPANTPQRASGAAGSPRGGPVAVTRSVHLATAARQATPGKAPVARAATIPPRAAASQQGFVGSGGPIAIGAALNDDTITEEAAIDRFTTLTGTAPAIVSYGSAWGYGEPFYPQIPDAIVSRGATPLLAWMPYDPQSVTTQPYYANQMIADGWYDTYIDSWARAIAAWGRPMYIRLAYEMNGDWYPWSPGVNGNTAASYIAMWQHVHDIFAWEGATNVRFVWAPNVEYGVAGELYPFEAMYPGDGYVDWLGLSGYNMGTHWSWSGWQDAPSLFGVSYAHLTAMSGLPIMIAETGSMEEGGSKANWIMQTYLIDIPTLLPQVEAVVWFHQDTSGLGGTEGDWRINTSATALNAYATVAANPLCQGMLW